MSYLGKHGGENLPQVTGNFILPRFQPALSPEGASRVRRGAGWASGWAGLLIISHQGSMARQHGPIEPCEPAAGIRAQRPTLERGERDTEHPPAQILMGSSRPGREVRAGACRAIEEWCFGGIVTQFENGTEEDRILFLFCYFFGSGSV